MGGVVILRLGSAMVTRVFAQFVPVLLVRLLAPAQRAPRVRAFLRVRVDALVFVVVAAASADGRVVGGLFGVVIVCVVEVVGFVVVVVRVRGEGVVGYRDCACGGGAAGQGAVAAVVEEGVD